MKNRKYYYLFWAGIFLMTFAGCASLRETGKKIWGTSIAHLEEARAQGQSAVVALKSDEVFVETQKILEASGAKVYLKDPSKRYLAAMGFSGHVDTTEVGIFLTPQDDGATKVEVASMSPSLVDQVARFLFEQLKAKGGNKG